MTEDKKSELKRLIIYLAFSFGIAWIMFFVFMPEGKTWDELGQLKQSFIALGMLAPVIAHVITRLITKEGFAMTGERKPEEGTDAFLLRMRKVIRPE